MIRAALGFSILASTAACAAHASPAASPIANAAPKGVASEAWAQLVHALPGVWTAPSHDPNASKKPPFTVSYRLVSNESALEETWGVGSGHETLTIFHPDGDALLLTHYCAQGNQPRLRVSEATAGTIVFRFLDATNVKPDASVLVERTLRLAGDSFDDTEVYKDPSGALDTTTTHFQRSAP